MEFYYLLIIIIVGILFTYLSCIRYVKGMRLNYEKNSDLIPIAMGIFFGGPALLITYMFPEIRTADKQLHYRYLICGIVFTSLQILLSILLCVFKVVTF